MKLKNNWIRKFVIELCSCVLVIFIFHFTFYFINNSVISFFISSMALIYWQTTKSEKNINNKLKIINLRLEQLRLYEKMQDSIKPTQNKKGE